MVSAAWIASVRRESDLIRRSHIATPQNIVGTVIRPLAEEAATLSLPLVDLSRPSANAPRGPRCTTRAHTQVFLHSL